LAEAWKTGEPGDVAALVDRIKDAPAEEVVETFLALRQAMTAAQALPGKLADVGRAVSETLLPALRSLGQVFAAAAAHQQQGRASKRRRRPGEGRRG
jgi:hypothetical protein